MPDNSSFDPGIKKTLYPDQPGSINLAGSNYGWVYIRMPDGSVETVPGQSPEAQKYPVITPTIGAAGNGKQGQVGWSDGKDGRGQGGTPAAAPATPQAGATNGQRDTGMDYNKAITDFYAKMTAPLDMNDPQVKQALATGVNNNQRFSNYSGVKGGLSQAGLAKSAMGATTALASQRQQMGLQALTLGSNRDLGIGTEAGQNNRYASDLAQSNAINQSNAERANLQMLASVGGNVASGLAQFAKPGQGATGVPNNVGGAGSYNTESGYTGSDPSDFSNPYGGY